MRKRFRSRMTYANVASTLALVFALGTGGAYAANTIGSDDVIDESLQSVDVKNGDLTTADIKNRTIKDEDLSKDSVGTLALKDKGTASVDIADGAVVAANLADGAVAGTKLGDGSVTSAKVLDDSEVGGGLGPQDLATNAVAQSEIATDGVAATEIQDNSIDAGEIVDFGLTNQDVGVLYAEVSSSGTLADSSGGVTSSKIGSNAGNYEVDFGRNVSNCTAVATLGGSTTTIVPGEVNVADRSGNVEGVFVDTNNSDGSAADKAFRLVVVC